MPKPKRQPTFVLSGAAGCGAHDRRMPGPPIATVMRPRSGSPSSAGCVSDHGAYDQSVAPSVLLYALTASASRHSNDCVTLRCARQHVGRGVAASHAQHTAAHSSARRAAHKCALSAHSCAAQVSVACDTSRPDGRRHTRTSSRMPAASSMTEIKLHPVTSSSSASSGSARDAPAST